MVLENRSTTVVEGFHKSDAIHCAIVLILSDPLVKCDANDAPGNRQGQGCGDNCFSHEMSSLQSMVRSTKLLH